MVDAQLSLLPPELLNDTRAAIVVPGPQSRPRGHAPKIAAALDALAAAGQLPEPLRLCERIERCDEWFKQQGYKVNERPSRSSYVRFFRRRRST
jgi:hypothetical protein